MAAATGLIVISFWLLVFGIASAADGAVGAGALALSLAMVPFVFILAAFGSGHDRAGGAVVWAMLLAAGVGASVLFLDPASALIGGYAAGATVTVRQHAAVSMSRRAVFALLATGLMVLAMRFLTPLALLVGPGLPYMTVGVADAWTARGY